jgi:hypothetical protein
MTYDLVYCKLQYIKRDANMVEKRQGSRIPISLDAEIVSGGKSYFGIILNFSEEGLYMVTATANTVIDITPSTILELKCTLPSDTRLEMKCEVKWFQTKPSPHGTSFSMGMEIVNPPKEYKEFVSTAL